MLSSVESAPRVDDQMSRGQFDVCGGFQSFDEHCSPVVCHVALTDVFTIRANLAARSGSFEEIVPEHCGFVLPMVARSLRAFREVSLLPHRRILSHGASANVIFIRAARFHTLPFRYRKCTVFAQM